jgi:hypothetical protein
MAREIPEIVRAAAGLAATVLDEARKLPETLPGLPVRIIGLAMQKAMWLQQQYSGLVARGDELFTGLRGEDEPGLATFDEDLPAEPAPRAGGGFRESAFDRAVDTLTDEDLADLPEDVDPAVAPVEDIADRFDGAQEVLDELAIEDLVDDEAAGLPQEPAPDAVVAAVEDITVQVEQAGIGSAGEALATGNAESLENALLEADAEVPAAEAAVVATAEDVLDVDVVTPDGGVATVEATVTDEGVAAPEPATEATDEAGTPVAAATGPGVETAGAVVPSAIAATTTEGTTAPPAAPVDGYDDWSIAQLRGRLRGYAEPTVRQLLGYEESTLAREPYLRMLRNRLERLQSESA